MITKQCYISTDYYPATKKTLTIRLLDGIRNKSIRINSDDDIKRWWEVIDRSAGKAVEPANWDFDEATGSVTIHNVVRHHEYTVSFLSYHLREPGHVSTTPFSPSLPLICGELRRCVHEGVQTGIYSGMFADCRGYSAPVSLHVLRQFESEVAYPFRPEYIVDEGHFNSKDRVPSRQYLDFMAFWRRNILQCITEMTRVCHAHGEVAHMIIGEDLPYLHSLADTGLDRVVADVSSARALRLIADIRGVKYTEARLPACASLDSDKWLSIRRALLRKSVDYISQCGGPGLSPLVQDGVDQCGQLVSPPAAVPSHDDHISQCGCPKKQDGYPGFAYISGEFRQIHDNVSEDKPFTYAKVAVLNCYGKLLSWGLATACSPACRALNDRYDGVIEILAGAPVDVCFISFNDIMADPDLLSNYDAIINIGDVGSAHSGGFYWQDERLIAAIRHFIMNGGGFIGVGAPSAHEWQGRTLQMAAALGVEKSKFNKSEAYDEIPHFITAEINDSALIDFGGGERNIHKLEGSKVLAAPGGELQLAVNKYHDGRCVYFGGLPYSAENARLLLRSLLWCTGREKMLRRWFSENPAIDVHAYLIGKHYCIVNNSREPQDSVIYDGRGNSEAWSLKAQEMIWRRIE